ncbi:MAG: radical SAM protein [Clostridia bacterium]|nr:radical SAM protein [Clostridia bacterium]
MMQKPAPSATPLTDFIFSKASRARVPLSGTFELSPVCNFACRMCYVRKTPAEVAASPRGLLSKEHWLQIAEEARDAGMLYLLLTGGEPLLWPGFWDLYEALVRMGILVSINTNGSLIGDEAVARFKELPPRRINITLYGANDATYERLCGAKNVFSRVDEAITKLQQAGITVKLNGSLTPENVEDVDAMIAYAQEKKLIYEIATYMFPPIRRDPSATGVNERFAPQESAACRLHCYRLQAGEERYQSYLKSIREGSIPPPGLDESCTDPLDGTIRCRAGKASFWITWDGWLTPCGLLPEPKADLLAQNFTAAWKTLTGVCDGIVTSGLCAQCENQQLCHPCAAIAYAETGTTAGVPTYLCETVRAMQDIAAGKRT